MRGRVLMSMMTFVMLCPPGIEARGIDRVISNLAGADGYRGALTYEVTMPSFSQPIVYNLELAQGAPTDTLAPCTYLIDWNLKSPAGESRGWSTYFDGHHYRHADGRLQEYHTQWDPIPFGVTSRNGAKGGVQQNAQFTELLPAFIARDLRNMLVDSSYTVAYIPDTIISGTHRQAVKSVQRYRGYDTREWLYVGDSDNGLPVMLLVENNPGSISEQSVKVIYSPLPAAQLVLSEEMLAERYPEQFAKDRASFFRVESLQGQPLPSFSLPTLTGERFTHRKSQPLDRPSVVAFINPRVGNPAQVIGALREAADQSPRSFDIVWALLSSNTDEIETLTGQERINERTLINAYPFARDCGVSSPPVMMLVDSDGIVEDVIIGLNNNLVNDVIQKMTIIK